MNLVAVWVEYDLVVSKDLFESKDLIRVKSLIKHLVEVKTDVEALDQVMCNTYWVDYMTGSRDHNITFLKPEFC